METIVDLANENELCKQIRLSVHAQVVIKETVDVFFGSQARVYLFGSRTDFTKQGGDIDLLVLSSGHPEDLFIKKIKAISRVQLALGDQKIDLVVHNPEIIPMPKIIEEALKTGVLL